MFSKFTLLFYLIIFLILGIRFYFFLTTPKAYKEGDYIRITARIFSEPVLFEKSQYLKIEGLKIYLPIYPDISYGDKVIVEGWVVSDKLANPKLIKMDSNGGGIFDFRRTIIDFYERTLPSPHVGLVAGMVLGSKSNIPSDFWEKLKSSGTAHVVVASGMNVSLVATFLLSFLAIFWKRNTALVVTLIGIWGYALVSGLDAPIIRAVIMATITFTASLFGRLSTAIKALFVSAFIMLLINPGFLWDLGFLLSFFATLSLVVFEPKVKKILSFVPNIVKEDLSTSLSAQIGVFPILYLSFGQLNFLSPLVNVLVLWTVVPITIIGMLAGIVLFLYEPLGKMILFLTYPLTSWFIWVVEFFG